MVCLSAERGWCGRTRGIFAVRRRLFNGRPGGDVLTSLLPAMQAEGRRRHQPIGQDRKRLPAAMTDSTSHPDAFVTVIVGAAESPPVTNDRVLPANRAPPREETQWHHPASVLACASGRAIKRIAAACKAGR